MQEHGPHVAADFPQGFLRQGADILFPQVGVEPVRLEGDGGVLHDGGRDGEEKVIQVVPGQQQHPDLGPDRRQGDGGADGRFHVLLLVDKEQGGLVGEEIRYAGVDQVQHIDQGNVGDILGNLLHEKAQEGR